MIFDPASLNLSALFVDPHMFDSRRTWRRAGFHVQDPAKDIECMVAAHPSAPGCLFKRYTNDVSRKKQHENYARRLAGAEALAKFIANERLAHVVVAKKRLCKLSDRFRPSHILVVERLDIFSEDESARRYRDVADPVLRDLLAVLVRFKGLDSNSKNVAFTRDGRIAFVDLEHWDRTDRDRVRLKNIGDYLSKEKFKLARKILGTLE